MTRSSRIHAHLTEFDCLVETRRRSVGGRIRDIMRLRRQFGEGRWRKLKGIARVQVFNGETRIADVHWYEAHGIGRKKMKIKRFLS